MNRLNLDFSIQTCTERAEFLNNYMKRPEFEKNPLTPEELETCGNYVLWGKDNDGKNSVQKKEIQIQTKNGTWNRKEEESLDALMETPTFNENLIVRPTAARAKVVKENFSRKDALAKAPEDIKKLFITLFRDIDETDLLLNYYDLLHGKRKNPPREELLINFTDEEKERFQQAAAHLNQYKYLKLRHQLVELRRQQFSLKDMYSCPVQVDITSKVPIEDREGTFDVEVVVYPLGLVNGNTINSKVFSLLDQVHPVNFTENEIELVIKDYWKRQKETPQFYFNFEELEHVYNLLLLLIDFEWDAIEEKVDSTLSNLLKTLKYYISLTTLSDIQQEILDLKIKKVKNQDIADYINNKYGKSYTANYISTIFKQKIIKKITEMATYHKDVVLNLPYEENFKKCSTCGEWLLKDARNFVKKSRAKDGFTSRCKRCDKRLRDQKKESK